jgi:hypothetical protein
VIIRLFLALPFLFLTAFCVYGFLASYELNNPVERLPWQSLYGLLGLIFILAFLFLIKPKKK